MFADRKISTKIKLKFLTYPRKPQKTPEKTLEKTPENPSKSPANPQQTPRKPQQTRANPRPNPHPLPIREGAKPNDIQAAPGFAPTEPGRRLAERHPSRSRPRTSRARKALSRTTSKPLKACAFHARPADSKSSARPNDIPAAQGVHRSSSVTHDCNTSCVTGGSGCVRINYSELKKDYKIFGRVE